METKRVLNTNGSNSITITAVCLIIAVFFISRSIPHFFEILPPNKHYSIAIINFIIISAVVYSYSIRISRNKSLFTSWILSSLFIVLLFSTESLTFKWLSYCFCVAIIEEIIFRFLLFEYTNSYFEKKIFAYLVPSLIFALGHSIFPIICNEHIEQYIYQVFLSLVFSSLFLYLYRSANSIIVAIILHGLFNFTFGNNKFESFKDSVIQNEVIGINWERILVYFIFSSLICLGISYLAFKIDDHS